MGDYPYRSLEKTTLVGDFLNNDYILMTVSLSHISQFTVLFLFQLNTSIFIGGHPRNLWPVFFGQFSISKSIKISSDVSKSKRSASPPHGQLSVY